MAFNRKNRFTVRIEDFQRRLIDEGKLIEAGWIALRITTIPREASQTQLDEMRNAFFAGAQHLFSTLLSVLEPGSEPTENDLRRMNLINEELNAFIRQFRKKHDIGG